MNICFLSSSSYFKYLSVTIKSIELNNEDVDLNYYLLLDKSDECEIRKQMSQLKIRGSLNLIPIDPASLERNHQIDTRWPTVGFSVLNICNLLPYNVERILFIEVDTIVTASLQELYNVDFENNLIAGCPMRMGCNPNLTKEQINKNELVLNRNAIVNLGVNGGVVLFNIQGMRAKRIFPDYFGYSFTNVETALSESLKGQILYLNPSRFNYRCKWKNEYEKYYYCNDKVIIHYHNDDAVIRKPWLIRPDKCNYIHYVSPAVPDYKERNKNIEDTFIIWWEYAEKSEFYDVIAAEMSYYKQYQLSVVEPGIIAMQHDRDKYVQYSRIGRKIIVDNYLQKIVKKVGDLNANAIGLYGNTMITDYLLKSFGDMQLCVKYVIGTKKYHNIPSIAISECKNYDVDLIVVCTLDDEEMVINQIFKKVGLLCPVITAISLFDLK